MNMKDMSLLSKVTLFVVSALIVCSVAIGVFAYILNRNEAISENARRALSIAQTVTAALSPEQFEEIMTTGNTNDYYEEYTKFLDGTLERCNLTYLYVLDRNYDSDVVYFAEGYPYKPRPDEPEILFRDTETVDAYAPELFETLKTGKDSTTGIYDMGGYGKMVSGFTAILDKSGRVLGVVGVDLAINDSIASSRRFGLSIIFIAGAICLIAVFLSIWLIKTIISGLNNIFDSINAVTEQVSDGTRQIADSSQSVAQGSSEQMSAIELLLTGVQTLFDNIKQNMDMTKQAVNVCTTIKLSAEEGNYNMGQMSAAMKEIDSANQNIGNVVHTIDEIARQVNILALNASIEAARSGEHGKGFSVVSEEVRNLAVKVAEAAENANIFVKNSIEKVMLGREIVEQTASNLNGVVGNINHGVAIVDEIAKFFSEQETYIREISRDISNIPTIIQQNNSAAEESASACQEINVQSVMLNDIVSKYRVT